MIQEGSCVGKTVYIDSRYSKEPTEAVLKGWRRYENNTLYAVCHTAEGERMVKACKLYRTKNEHQNYYGY